jgi:RsiW-degrading membrane proteinase PrsW (M82 family)
MRLHSKKRLFKPDFWKYFLLALAVGIFCNIMLDFVGIEPLPTFIITNLIICPIVMFAEAPDDPNP